MIKRLFNVVLLTLAMNFIALAGAVGWLYQTKRLDREKVTAIRELIFAEPVIPAAPTTQPDAATTQPILRLEQLLSKQAGRSAAEQTDFIRESFDAQMTQLERRARELNDLQRQVDLAKAQLVRDRTQLGQAESELAAKQAQADKLAGDKGFQDSLALYTTMPAKQVKAIFMTLDEQTVVNYLQAMQPRTAAKIIKEFKSPEETSRIQSVLEKIRQAQASAKE
jgi:hypothetical protein